MTFFIMFAGWTKISLSQDENNSLNKDTVLILLHSWKVLNYKQMRGLYKRLK